MKAFKLTLFIFSLLALSSCNNNDAEPLYIQKQFSQLNVVIAPWQSDNDLLPWKSLDYGMIINSVEDVYATQTGRFIEENPNWLQVDFSTKSIVAYRSLMFSYDSWQNTEVKKFAQYVGESDININNGEYIFSFQENYSKYVEPDDESQYRIYQVAIVTDKIPSDATVQYWSNAVYDTTSQGN
ncbi:MAG: hypothetical protein LIP09_16600 [Bacteroidales bacterium]|nr:hypothetical protein [Bacteroidales bacterium]